MFKKFYFPGLCFSLLLIGTPNLFAQSVSFVSTQQACDHDGILTVNASGIVPPVTFTYYLANSTVTHPNVNSTSDVLNNYSGGPVTVYAMNGNSVAYGVFSAPPFTYSLSSTPAVCPALGSATVTVNGGATPYTYQWTDVNAAVVGAGSTLNAAGGVYNIKITDANGCVYGSLDQGDSFGINTTAPFTFDINSTPASCTNGTATITNISGNGLPPYSYLWSNNATSQSINNLLAGYYTATVTDAQGCALTHAINLNQIPQITVNATPTPATCTQNDGSIIAFGSGGGTALFLCLEQWAGYSITN